MKERRRPVCLCIIEPWLDDFLEAPAAAPFAVLRVATFSQKGLE
jgi:hypothetical protein